MGIRAGRFIIKSIRFLLPRSLWQAIFTGIMVQINSYLKWKNVYGNIPDSVGIAGRVQESHTEIVGGQKIRVIDRFDLDSVNVLPPREPE